MEEELKKPEHISDWHNKHREDVWSMKHWRAWGSWYSWGSPVGLGLFFIEIALFIFILHYTFK